MSVSKVIDMYLNYVPLPIISKSTGMSRVDVMKCIGGVKDERAKQSLEAIDMSSFSDDAPVTKMLITKLSIIRNELFRRAHSSLQTLTYAETVDNYIKRVKVNDITEWTEAEEVTIIDETGSYVTYHWVFLAEIASDKDMVVHAKVLTDKFLMKPDNIYTYADWDKHVSMCNKWGLSPKEYSESELEEYISATEEWQNEMGNK